MEHMENLVSLLWSKDHNAGCAALRRLEELSGESDAVYLYTDRFAEMLDSKSSYVRNRGLLLLAENVQWDEERKMDRILDKYLLHVVDEKPITARQCIQGLRNMISARPEWIPRIKQAMENN
ncbi:SufBD protein [Lacrimispora sp. NSJ-141]|uniref:SufBD protein n=1 Tax=Lientehia hominis TaxID=2897778 RepID=A0AAP2RGB9_9FIRM|nr:SufBD protein [Lientehia hominis]MCD2491729.1 SufBD protein [Lientehia hominis]